MEIVGISADTCYSDSTVNNTEDIMITAPTFDETTQQWVGEHVTRNAEGELVRDTQWFHTEEAAKLFSQDLNGPQSILLAQARALAVHSHHGVLVSGTTYRTAQALERRGHGTLQYQGPGNRGWFRAYIVATPALVAEGKKWFGQTITRVEPATAYGHYPNRVQVWTKEFTFNVSMGARYVAATVAIV